MRLLALLLGLILALPAPAAAAAAKPRPARAADWTRTVVPTPAGGFRMGNPTAKVKLVEFASMTCPHCRAFDQTGATPLISSYVKTGRVSYEIRNFVRDPFDLTAALVARCGGARSFFPLTRKLLADQPNWIARLQAIARSDIEALRNLPPTQQLAKIAGFAGFTGWGAANGLPAARTSACLADSAAVDRLVKMNGAAIDQFNIKGTPSFLINGKLSGAGTWEQLEPELKSALR